MEMFSELTFTGTSQPKPALVKLKNLLNTPRFCTICYETAEHLQELDDCPLVKEIEEGSNLSLRQIIEEIFQDAGSRIILSSYICSVCQLKLIYAYTFIKTTQNRANNYEYYLTRLDSETVDLLNCTKDNTTCANAVIVLEEPESNEKELENLEKFRWRSNQHQQPVKEKFHVIERPSRHIVTKNYVCEYCDKEFCDKKFLLTHLNTCGLCKTKPSFDKGQDLTQTHHVECPKCQERPCEHEKFIKNFEQQKERRIQKIKCLECVFTTTTLRPLIDHVEKKHMEELADHCELCGKIFYMREQYFSHFETFHDNYKICSYCSSVIPSESLNNHEMVCIVAEKSYSCDKCPSRFESEMLATIHTISHNDIKPKDRIVLKRRYTCPLCPETFNGKIKLQKHCNTAHGVESYRNNHCQFCDIKFDTKKEYLLHVREMQHMAGINPNHSYRHKCQYCDYTARHAFILKTHMNRYHLKVMPFQCDLCKKRFLDKRKLKAHIDRHMGAGKRVCAICGDTLGSTTALIKHTRLHTGERPYPCHLCDVSLNSASERKFHVLRKHTEKSHPCPLCETKFHTPYFVRRHIQQVHWKRKEKFDHTKLEGLAPEHYELFRDRRMVVL